MRLLFLVPARGGSKGLPGKNLALVGGIPMVGRAVRVARHAGVRLGQEFRVVCSTDDPAIARTAQEWGAEVPFIRPAALATDEAKTLDVVLHALDALDEEFDAVVLLQVTSPLTQTEDVVGAVKLFRETGGPVVSVCQSEHPVEWHYRMDADGRLTPALPNEYAYQRQLVQPSYRPNGAVYVASPRQVRGGGFWVGETHGLAMPAERSVDVDTPADVAIAQALLEARPVPCIEIAGRKIGPGYPCFIVAEAGVNHNGNVELALKLVDEAAAAGADAVKFQTFKADRVVSPSAPKAEYQKTNTGRDESQLEMIRRLELTPSEHRRVFDHCRGREILYLASAFDLESVDLLADMGVAAYKVASGELTNPILLGKMARHGKPVLLSTGMADLREIRAAVEVLRAAGDPPLLILHCVSNYPAAAVDCNLSALTTLRVEFGVPVGWSDHTLGTHIAVAAVARGAHLVEKHFTLDRKLPGPDHAASLEPAALRQLVRTIRETEAAVGTAEKRRQPSEDNTAAVARRSLHAARDIPVGHALEETDLVLLRPGNGIPADQQPRVLGRRTRRPISAGATLQPEDLE